MKHKIPHLSIYIYLYRSRTQVSPGRTPSPMEYNTAYSPPGVQQQQSPQYQPSISPIMQMPSSSTNANLYSYTPEQVQLQQAEPNLYTLGKARESMSHARANQGPELQPIELDNASKYSLTLQNSSCNMF